MTVEVFCRSEGSFTIREIAQVFQDSGSFEDDLIFFPPLDDPKADSEDWAGMGIDYERGKEEISVYRYVKKEKDFAVLLEETLGIQEKHLEPLPDVEAHLKESKLIYVFEYDETFIDDDAERLITVLCKNIANRLDGVVSASEGFYDKDMNFLNEKE